MHFSGPPHSRVQAVVLHSGLELQNPDVYKSFMRLIRRSQPKVSAVNVMAMATQRRMSGGHAQHACPQSPERHRSERRLLRNDTLY
jgi:hypothetical protein